MFLCRVHLSCRHRPSNFPTSAGGLESVRLWWPPRIGMADFLGMLFVLGDFVSVVRFLGPRFNSHFIGYLTKICLNLVVSVFFYAIRQAP